MRHRRSPSSQVPYPAINPLSPHLRSLHGALKLPTQSRLKGLSIYEHSVSFPYGCLVRPEYCGRSWLAGDTHALATALRLLGFGKKKRRSVRFRSLPAQAPPLLGGSRRLTPLLAGRSETEAEAQGAEAAGGQVPAPNRGTGAVRRVDPGTTAVDAARAVRWTDRITHCAGRVSPEPVRAPFPYVPVHIVKTPRVGRVLPDIGCLSGTTQNIRLIGSQFVAERKRRLRSPSAGILPLSFRRQLVRHPRRQAPRRPLRCSKLIAERSNVRQDTFSTDGPLP